MVAISQVLFYPSIILRVTLSLSNGLDDHLSEIDEMSNSPGLTGVPATLLLSRLSNVAFGGCSPWDCPFHPSTSLRANPTSQTNTGLVLSTVEVSSLLLSKSVKSDSVSLKTSV